MSDRASLHLARLAEQNRLKKIQNTKSKTDIAKEEKERGFSTHFHGANASPASARKNPSSNTYVTGKSPVVMASRLAGNSVGGDIRPIKGLFENISTKGELEFDDNVDNIDNLDIGMRSKGEKGFPRSRSRYDNDNEYAEEESDIFLQDASEISDGNNNMLQNREENFGSEAVLSEHVQMHEVKAITSSPARFVQSVISASNTPDQSFEKGLSITPPHSPLRYNKDGRIEVEKKTSNANDDKDESESESESCSNEANVDLSSTLLSHVNALSDEQQQALLALLMQQNRNGSGNGSGVTIKKNPIAISAISEQAAIGKGPVKSTYTQITNHKKQTTKNADDIDRKNMPFDFDIIFRIKIMTLWDNSSAVIGSGNGSKTKTYASLKALRLHFSKTQTSQPIPVVIGNNFDTEVYRGTDCLPLNSVEAHTLPNLLSGYSGPTGWRAPLDSEVPLELRFTSNKNFAKTDDLDDLLKSLTLSIWNSPIASGAAKDVDIYFRDNCIWSGRLPAGSAGSRPSSALARPGSSQNEKSKGQLLPSLTLPLYSPDLAVVSGDASVDNSMSAGAATEIDSSKPLWLNSDMQNVKGNDILSNQGVLIHGIRASPLTVPDTTDADVDADVSSNFVLNSSDKVPKDGLLTLTASPNKIRNAKIESTSINEKKTRRRRQLGEMSSDTISELDKRISSSKKTDRTEDNFLRKSLDAMATADRASRSRLQVYTDSSSMFEDNYNKIEVSRSLFRDQSNTNVGVGSPAVSHLEKTKIESLDTPSQNQAVDAVGKRVLGRNQRIDEVQSVVQSALAGLADIMSGIKSSSGKSTSKNSSPLKPPSNDASSSDIVVPNFEKPFDIPISPSGSVLQLEIFSTWGDAHYVGLNGIDVFDNSGNLIIPLSDSLPIPSPTKYCDAKITSIIADPPDINILPEFSDVVEKKDPRTAQNLVDGTNFTRDDMHVWLAPLESSPTTDSNTNPTVLASITIDFSEDVSIGMIRVFNYNKSRLHAQRGVRFCRFLLSGKEIFRGELRMAEGLLTDPSQAAEVVLFTTDSRTLSKIAEHDEERGYYIEDNTKAWVKKLSDRHRSRRPIIVDDFVRQKLGERPKTQATNVTPSTPPSKSKSKQMHVKSPPQHSPSTAVQAAKEAMQSTEKGKKGDRLKYTKDDNIEDEDEDDQFMRELHELNILPEKLPKVPHADDFQPVDKYIDSISKLNLLANAGSIRCQSLRIEIDSTWGDKEFVGLCGVNVLGENGNIVNINCASIKAEPYSLEELGYIDDPRTPDRLVNRVNDVSDDSNMWLIPYTRGGKHFVEFPFSSQNILGVEIWNYNKCSPSDDLYRGAKYIQLSIRGADGILNNLGSCILRMGPGCDCVEFGQLILLQDIPKKKHVFEDADVINMHRKACSSGNGESIPKYISPSLNQDYEGSRLPSALLWKFTFFANWDDGYFIGLDKIEMFDSDSKRIDPIALGATISACPHSLRDISDTNSNDPRIPQSLFDNDSGDSMPWLAPLSRCMTDQERGSMFKSHLKRKSYENVKPNPKLFEDNTLFVSFRTPVCISVIRFYNYSKTPARGVRSFSVNADGLLLFMGDLLPSPTETTGNIDRQGQSIVFTPSPKVARTEKSRVSYCGKTDQDVLCINERKVMVRSKTMYKPSVNPAIEGITSDLDKRPTTAAIRPKTKKILI